MKILLCGLSTHWQHLLWRLGLLLPLLFTRYSDAEEVYEDRTLSGWKLVLASLLVIGLSIWSFTL